MDRNFHHPTELPRAFFQLISPTAGGNQCFAFYHYRLVLLVLQLHVNEIIQMVPFLFLIASLAQPSILGGGSVEKNPPGDAGDAGSIPSLGRSPGRGDGYPLQYSCLRNTMDREPSGLQSVGSQESRTLLSD